jgi:hypothetical protein
MYFIKKTSLAVYRWMMYVGAPVDCNGGDSDDALSVIVTPPCVGFGRLAVIVGAGQTTLAEAVVADA